MSTYLDQLRKKSSENFEKLKSDVDKLSYRQNQNDERNWTLTVDKSGNGFAILRFLPPAENENTAFVKRYSHFFKGETGKYFAENCPTTLGKSCPVCDRNTEIWRNNPEEKARKLVGDSKRHLEYISNVLVIQDRANPENEGKVFLYRYGAKIFEKIKSAIKPEFEDEVSFDPFSIDSGANFVLKARTKDGYRNYDLSYFEKPSALCDGNDDDIITVLGKLYSLDAIVDPKLFKDYDELDSQLKRVSVKEGSKPIKKTVEEKIEEESPTKDAAPWEEDASSQDNDLNIDDILAGLD